MLKSSDSAYLSGLPDPPVPQSQCFSKCNLNALGLTGLPSLAFFIGALLFIVAAAVGFNLFYTLVFM